MTNKTMVGKWEGRDVHLDQEADADAIEIIRYLTSVHSKLMDDSESMQTEVARLTLAAKRLEQENAELITEMIKKDSGPSLILPN